MNRIKIAILGLGAIAKVQQEALAGLPEFDYVAACDADENKRDACRAPAFYADVNEFLSNCAAEAVLLSTPPATHFPLALQCLRAGKSVLTEKPAALSLEEIAALYREAEATGVLFRTAYHAAHGEDIEKVLQNAETLLPKGKPRAIRCTFCDPYLQDGKLEKSRAPLDGSWSDSGINALSVCARFADLAALSLCEKAERRDPETGIIVHATHTFCGGGLSVRIETAWDDGRNYKATELVFEGGESVFFEHTAQRVTKNAAEKSGLLFEGCPQERMLRQYRTVLRSFAGALQEGESDEKKTMLLHRLLFE